MGRRGRRPRTITETLPVAPSISDYDDKPPKFCFAYLQKGFDVESLPDDRARAALLRALQVRSTKTWRELKSEHRHGLGFELIPKDQIRAPIPEGFQDQRKFLVFRYHDRHPMAGVRVRDIFHIIWVEAKYGDLYDHGK